MRYSCASSNNGPHDKVALAVHALSGSDPNLSNSMTASQKAKGHAELLSAAGVVKTAQNAARYVEGATMHHIKTKVSDRSWQSGGGEPDTVAIDAAAPCVAESTRTDPLDPVALSSVASESDGSPVQSCFSEPPLVRSCQLSVRTHQGTV